MSKMVQPQPAACGIPDGIPVSPDMKKAIDINGFFQAPDELAVMRA
jgi:hypothetical protein